MPGDFENDDDGVGRLLQKYPGLQQQLQGFPDLQKLLQPSQTPTAAAPVPSSIPFPQYSQNWAFQGGGHPSSIPTPMLPAMNIKLPDDKKKK